MRLIQFTFIFFFAFQLFSQSQERIDFTRIEAEIKPYSNNTLSGVVRYYFDVMTPLDSIVLDAIKMDFSDIYFKEKKISESVKYDGKKLKIGLKLQPGSYKIEFGYTAYPKQTVYFFGYEDGVEGNEQIWTQGQGKYTSHWLPSFDNMNEKVELDLTFHVPSKYAVISNGKLLSAKNTGNLQSWRFDMTRPMSSYLAAFAIGDFDKKVIQSKSGIPIELYYEPTDSLKVEPTYRYTKEIFDFLEQEIGVAYPWQNYKQVPVQDFLYAGMENTTCTIFSNQYMIDSTAFVDKNYVNVNAHELAHQWFGNLVTEQSGKHHWLHEGFATYYAYLAEQELFGDDHFYWKLYETAKTLNNLSENGDGEALTNPNANSLTFYEKGAWALVMLRERVGDIAFKKGIQNYLNKYAYANVTISDFLLEVETSSGQSLNAFRTKWLENEEFPWKDVTDYLANKSPSLNTFFDLKQQLKSGESIQAALTLYGELNSEQLEVALIKNYHSAFYQELIERFSKSQRIKVRQAVAMSLDSIPQYLKADFENLLKDQSYVTQEVALFKLWQAFPENRTKYLDQLDNVFGLPNKNIRLLWLTLALITPDFRPENKKAFHDELNGYTASQYNFEVRQLAFQYLNQIKALSDASIVNLIRATDHHVWQFKKSSRNLIRDLATTDQNRFKSVLQTVGIEEQNRIKEIIAK